MRALIAAAALLLAPAAFAQTVPDPVGTVYDKALGRGWENWSWARTELSTEGGGSYMPIAVDAQGYGGLYLHHAAFSTAPYHGLHMLIAAVGGDVTLRVMLVVAGKAIPDGDKMEGGQPVALMKRITVKPGGWTDVLIPLNTIGGENARIDGFMVVNDSAQRAPRFFVADISFRP